jgi:hypothetical protein
MLATIAPTNTSISAAPPAIDVSAGPGQIPAKPQPMPKTMAPANSRASRVAFAGSENFAAISGRALRPMNHRNGACTATALAITRQARIPLPCDVQKPEDTRGLRPAGKA